VHTLPTANLLSEQLRRSSVNLRSCEGLRGAASNLRERDSYPRGLIALTIFKFVGGDSGGGRYSSPRIQNGASTPGFRPREFGPDRAIRCQIGCQSAQGRCGSRGPPTALSAGPSD
jgi:hypothetical protein